ncbi:uncharacterized protein G2W53_019434 [Senna tora]|uniref:Uncharacterized protein n=1 Tax=Senna tora TaxID=362788 RepID=A0A834TTH8_9FABA|nr:uncharacterized protein G2W53_019434 [Senna tora]
MRNEDVAVRLHAFNAKGTVEAKSARALRPKTRP